MKQQTIFDYLKQVEDIEKLKQIVTQLDSDKLQEIIVLSSAELYYRSKLGE